MIVALISWLQSLIVSAGSLGVLGASFLSEVIWVVPSSLIQASFGFLLFQGATLTLHNILLLILLVVIPGTIGATIGSLPFYLLTFWGGKLFTQKYGKYFGMSAEKIEHFEQKFSQTKKGSLALFVSRAIPIIPSTTTTIVFGLIGVRFWQYVLCTFLGMLPRVFIFSILGWQFGLGYQHVLRSLGSTTTSILFMALVLGVIGIAIHTKGKKHSR